jgi:pyruvate-ferredoxin/flavodoxin oxidoreductase
MTGVVQNQDSYMKGRIGQRAFYDRLPAELAASFAEWTRLTGRRYGGIDAYRTEDASEIVVAMGTIADTAVGVVDHLRAAGRAVGCVAVTSFRPFPSDELWTALRSARAVAVIERTDEPAAADNPLTREVKAACYDHAAEGVMVPRVRSVSAGLGSRDVAAGDILAVFHWLADRRSPSDRRHVVLGVRHPLALETRPLDLRRPGTFSLRGHSIGGFGSVTTNKLVASVVGGLFGLQVQAYPRYGSEKKGLPTTYYLTVADERIRQHGELDQVEFVALHDVAAFRQGAPLRGLVDGGIVFVASAETEPEAIWRTIPVDARREILDRHIRLAALDPAELARTRAPRPDLVARMQGVALLGVFLRLTPFAGRAGLDREEVLDAVRPHLERFFGKRGRHVIDANLDVVGAAWDGVVDVTAAISALVPVSRHELSVLEVAR